MDWIDDYTIGVPAIDNQHKQLVKTITRLQNALTTPHLKTQISKTLKFIVDYSQHHFHDEEEFMATIGYPNLDTQKALHKKLIKEVRGILIQLKNKEPVNANDLINFLMTWLSNHILEEDAKIGQYIQRLQAKGSSIEKDTNLFLKEELIKKINELQDIFDRGFLTDEEYTNKKSYMISDFFHLQTIDTKVVLDENLVLLQVLFDDCLLTKAEYQSLQNELIESIDIQLILGRIKDHVEQLEYLKFLMDQGFVSQEAFESHKQQLIDSL